MLVKNRSFLLFLVGRSIDLVGSAMTPVVLALAVLQTTDSVTHTGLVLAANVLPTLLLMLVGGALADRLPRGRILTITCTLSAVTQLAMAAVLWAQSFNLVFMTVLAAISG